MAAQKSIALRPRQHGKPVRSTITIQRTKSPQGGTTPTPQPAKRIASVPVWVVVGPDGDESVYLSEGEAQVFCNTFGEVAGKPVRIEQRLATITAGQLKPVSSAQPFAVITDAGIIATAADIDSGLLTLQQAGRGHLMRLLCSDMQTREEESRRQTDEFIRKTNPLAAKMAKRYEAALDAVADALGEKIELHEPSGRAHANLKRGMRRATDRECYLASLYAAERMTIDLNRDLASQVVQKLTSAAKRLHDAASRVQAAAKAGKIPRPVVRRGKAVPA